MLGGYASFSLFNLLGVDPFASIPLSIIFLLLIGFILYRVLFVRMVKLPTEDKIRNTLLVGFGLGLILQNVAQRLWTADIRSITPDYVGAVFEVAGVRFPIVRVAGLVISFVALIGLQLFLRRTYTGKAIRATVEDWEAATMMGINVYRVYLLSFVMGAALAGVAGTLVGVGYSLEPAMGMHWTLKSMIVMVLGGFGSITGTFVGGIVLGVTESVASIIIGSNYRQVVGLVIFMLVLIVRQSLLTPREG
jgi:branched-chain amino acid transport system permease protein